ncbi:hypothetical protein [Streptomyces sp. NPDC001787]|uniref:hypothetical protein n=1 Tax=Streptomyces sp. NPDC001787 TaxID=3154523 RepID=UPI00331AA881
MQVGESRLEGLSGGEGAGVDDVSLGVHPGVGGRLVVGGPALPEGAYGLAGEVVAVGDPLLQGIRSGVQDQVVEAGAALAQRGEQFSGVAGVENVMGTMTGSPV